MTLWRVLREPPEAFIPIPVGSILRVVGWITEYGQLIAVYIDPVEHRPTTIPALCLEFVR